MGKKYSEITNLECPTRKIDRPVCGAAQFPFSDSDGTGERLVAAAAEATGNRETVGARQMVCTGDVSRDHLSYAR